MKQTMLLQLAPSPEQSTALLETMHAFNDACNAIAETAFAEQLANKFALQKLVYGQARTQCGLSSQLAIRAMSKVVDRYKRDKSIKPTFRREGAVTYDERVMFFKGLNTVSLLTLQGRVLGCHIECCVTMVCKQAGRKARQIWSVPLSDTTYQ